MASILCVDAEPHVANQRCRILETAGHRAISAWTQSDAIEKLSYDRYDVVITGWRLCEGSGESIAVAAQSLAPAPLVIISGFVDECPGTQPLLADIVFHKVIEPDQLNAIVDRLLHSTRHPSTLSLRKGNPRE